jgi:hypothetical protein
MTDGRLICEASSTIATSNVRRESSGWWQERQVVATMREPEARLAREATSGVGCLEAAGRREMDAGEKGKRGRL